MRINFLHFLAFYTDFLLHNLRKIRITPDCLRSIPSMIALVPKNHRVEKLTEFAWHTERLYFNCYTAGIFLCVCEIIYTILGRGFFNWKQPFAMKIHMYICTYVVFVAEWVCMLIFCKKEWKHRPWAKAKLVLIKVQYSVLMTI